jgi:hypothetical protein
VTAETRFMGRRVAGGAVVLVLVATSVAASQGASAPTISYPDFSSIAGLTLNGDAAQTGNALRLTPNASGKRGSAWSQTTIDTSQSFESSFRAFEHAGTAPPADGMTFTLQSAGVTALGANGGDHGYGGISPSIAVDVSLFPADMNGLDEQVSILKNGDTFHPVAQATSPTLLYGSPSSVWVDYDAKGHNLSVFVSPGTTKPAAPLLSTPVDLSATVGPAPYAGFTAGTGVLDADFDVLSWQVQGISDTTPPTVTCSASPNVLWPPNGKLVAVSTTVGVTDSDSGPAGFSLVSVSSNEGDAATESQGWTTGTADTSGFLQAARLGSESGRTYTLTYQGQDTAGNTATCSATVTVPHDQGR